MNSAVCTSGAAGGGARGLCRKREGFATRRRLAGASFAGAGADGLRIEETSDETSAETEALRRVDGVEDGVMGARRLAERAGVSARPSLRLSTRRGLGVPEPAAC